MINLSNNNNNNKIGEQIGKVMGIIFSFILTNTIVIVKSKYFLYTIVGLVSIYFINPFGIFDSAQEHERKLRAKTNKSIQEYVLSSADALEGVADSEALISAKVAENLNMKKSLEDSICGLKKQKDQLVINLDATCGLTPINTDVDTPITKSEGSGSTTGAAQTATTFNVYKSKDYPFQNFTYYTTARNIRLPFTEQLKQYKWRLNSDFKSQEYTPVKGNNVKERADSLLKVFGAPSADIWFKTAETYKIKPEVAICIAKADSSLGQELTTKNNFGNVGNNDRGDRVHFTTPEEGVAAIAKTLVNKYVGKNTKVGELSNGGRTNMGLPKCGSGNYCYATSDENWNVNVINCLSSIHDKAINEDFEFRIK